MTRLILCEKSVSDFGNGGLGGLSHETQFRDNHTANPLSLTEAYVKGRGNIRLLLESPDRPPLPPVSEKGLFENRLANRHRKHNAAVTSEIVTPDQGVDRLGIKHRYTGGGQDEMMLIAQIKNVDAIKSIVPAMIGFERVYRSDDVFAGELYLSICNGATQPLCRISEREENSRWFWSAVAYHPISEQIEGRFEIVNGIANDKGKFFWDGFIGFDEKNALGALWINCLHQNERHLGKERFNIPMQIIDVMFGPLNF